MLIDPRESFVDLDLVKKLPQVPVGEFVKYVEVANPHGKPVRKEGKLSVNLSARNKFGQAIAPYTYNPNTFNTFNLESTTTKKHMNEHIQKIALTMNEGEVAWLILEENFHGIIGFHEEAHFRIEIVKYEEIEKTLNEKPYDEQIGLVCQGKGKADELLKQGSLKEAVKVYNTAYCNFKGVPKKMKKALTNDQLEAHKQLGLNLCRNYIRALFKAEDYSKAKEIIAYVFNNLDQGDIRTKFLNFDVLRKNGEARVLVEKVKELDKAKLPEPFASEFAKIKKEVIKSKNSVLEMAFKQSLENDEMEKKREKVYARLPEECKQTMFDFREYEE